MYERFQLGTTYQSDKPAKRRTSGDVEHSKSAQIMAKWLGCDEEEVEQSLPGYHR